jgi:YegS/Rv2252/BmrU family lipid kinase
MNPAAGKGTHFHELIDDIHKVCDRRQVYYAVHITEKKREATEFVKKMCETCNEPMRFYACGGDGTIKEVAEGMIGYDHAELGIIPMGTGNDFVRNFEHPERLFHIDAQLDGESRKIDIMKYNDRYAINLINIGFDCEIAKQVALNRRNIFIPSKIAYTAGIAQKITQLGTATVDAKIYYDGVLYKGDRNNQICIFANGAYYGAGYYAAPAATPSDGIIDSCVVRKVTLSELLGLLGHYKAGTLLTTPKIFKFFNYRKCKKVEVIFDHPTDISVDGEIERIRDRMEISILHNAINLSLPKACQPIQVPPAVQRAARKHNQRAQ